MAATDLKMYPCHNPIVLTTVEYEGLTFFSEFFPLMDAESGDMVELPILVYDSTQDLAGLTADRVHIFLNFPQPDRLQVVELFVISNTSDLVVIPEQAGQPVVRFVLPEGAENLQFEEGTLGERFVKTENGFGDTAAILPGDTSHQILFAFEMLYKRKMTFPAVPSGCPGSTGCPAGRQGETAERPAD